MSRHADVKPELIRWAVNRSGIPIADFSETVRSWLQGHARPTYRQLEQFAKKAMVPFGYLFLDKPPLEKLPLPDYRTRKDDGVLQPSPNLIETIFEMQRRQDWMREYLIEEGQGTLGFVGSATVNEPITTLAERIRQGLALDSDWAQQLPNYEEALRHLREQVESSGILIFINGVVGNSTRRKLDPDEFQGFVLVDDVAPLIFVNGADYKGGQMFTIAHELAHVWIGQSALFKLDATQPADSATEKYCNRVAAEFSVPANVLSEQWPQVADTDDAIGILARRFKVSPVVVARRAMDRKLISREAFFKFYNRYMSQVHKTASIAARGGNFWNTQNTRVGRRFGEAVVSAAQEGRLSYSDAYDLTRLYGETFDKFARHLKQRGRP